MQCSSIDGAVWIVAGQVWSCFRYSSLGGAGKYEICCAFNCNRPTGETEFGFNTRQLGVITYSPDRSTTKYLKLRAGAANLPLTATIHSDSSDAKSVLAEVISKSTYMN